MPEVFSLTSSEMHIEESERGEKPSSTQANSGKAVPQIVD